MYYAVFYDQAEHARHYRSFESRSDFNKQYQTSWGRILNEGMSKRDALILCGATKEVLASLDDPASYQVIFEFTEKVGGFLGYRFRTNFHHSFELQKLQMVDAEIVIAKGVSEEEASKLLASVPPLCLYLAAVEDAFTYPATQISNALEMNLYNAMETARAFGEYLQDRLLYAPAVNSRMQDHFSIITSEMTAKAIMLKSVMSFYDFNANDLNLLARGGVFQKSIKNQCTQALKLFPVE